MSAFSVVEKRKPPSNVVVPLRAFDETWESRPKGDVCIGLRLVAEDDIQTARSQAGKIAKKLHPRAAVGSLDQELWFDAYRDALVRWIVARGTCDPNDVTRAWEGWSTAPEDIVAIALTTDGVRLIFNAWERMRIASDPTTPEATDEEIVKLAMAQDRLSTLPRAEAACLRRLLRHCLDQLGG